MACDFAASDDVVKDAVPLDTGTLASTVPPSVKVTRSPLGMATDLEVTVAVKVTGCVTREGDPEVVSVVTVVAGASV